MPSIENPSYDAAEFTSVPKTVSTEFGKDYPVGHALRVKGAGTIAITTAAGQSRTLNVNDGETIVVQYTAVTAMTGPTAFRIQVPKPPNKPDVSPAY